MTATATVVHARDDGPPGGALPDVARRRRR